MPYIKKSDGTWEYFVMPNIGAFKGATSSAKGDKGYVPAPAAGDQVKFLCGDGSWKKPETGNVTVDTALSNSSTNPVTNKAIKEGLDKKTDLTNTYLLATGMVTVPENADLNKYTTVGTYSQSYGAAAATITNLPYSAAPYEFKLVVEYFFNNYTKYLVQKLLRYNCCRMYIRESLDSGSTWTAWKEFVRTADLASVATSGSFADLKNKPNTISGYGITDAMKNNAINNFTTTDLVKRNVDNSYLAMWGGTTYNTSAELILRGGTYSNNAGVFSLYAATSSARKALLGYPSGQLTWDSKNIVRSVNGTNADANGNVVVQGVSLCIYTD